MDQDKDGAARANVVLDRIRPSLGGADIWLKEVKDGVAIIGFRKAITDASCHASKTRTTEEVVTEILEDELKEAVPGLGKVVIIAE